MVEARVQQLTRIAFAHGLVVDQQHIDNRARRGALWAWRRMPLRCLRVDVRVRQAAAVDAHTATGDGLYPEAVLIDHAQTWYELGQAYLRDERYEDAATQFQQLIDSQIERIMAPLYYVRAYHGLGMSHAALGNTQAAADAYAQFLSYWPRGTFDSERVQEAHAFMRDNPQLTQTLAR